MKKLGTVISIVKHSLLQPFDMHRMWRFVSMKLPPIHPDPNRPHLFHNLYFFGVALLLGVLLFGGMQIRAQHDPRMGCERPASSTFAAITYFKMA
jgi:hypothetical protein